MSSIVHNRSSIVKKNPYPLKHVVLYRRKPQPYQIKPIERLAVAKAMTIAAGLLCSDGIVMCADTEVTAGDGKYNRQKIFQHENWLLVSGAGWSDYIKMAFDKFCEKLIRPENPVAARSAIEEILLEIYDNHIFKYSAFQHPDGTPNLALIVGIRCLDGKMALIKTRDSAAILSSHYEAVGAGANVFEYWAKFFFDRKRSMAVVGVFAMFILGEAKSAVPGCGGGTMVCFLPTDPSTPLHHTFFRDEPLTGFPQNAINVLLESADLVNPGFAVGQFREHAMRLKGFFESQIKIQENVRQAFLDRLPDSTASSSGPELPPAQSGDAALE